MFNDKEIQGAFAELPETSLFCEIINRITENTWNFGPEEDDGTAVFVGCKLFSCCLLGIF